MKQGKFVGGPLDGRLVPFEIVDWPWYKAPDPETLAPITYAKEAIDPHVESAMNVVEYRRVPIHRSDSPTWRIPWAWFAAPGVSNRDVLMEARIDSVFAISDSQLSRRLTRRTATSNV